jgi:hypothetical protein
MFFVVVFLRGVSIPLNKHRQYIKTAKLSYTKCLPTIAATMRLQTSTSEVVSYACRLKNTLTDVHRAHAQQFTNTLVRMRSSSQTHLCARVHTHTHTHTHTFQHIFQLRLEHSGDVRCLCLMHIDDVRRLWILHSEVRCLCLSHSDVRCLW